MVGPHRTLVAGVVALMVGFTGYARGAQSHRLPGRSGMATRAVIRISIGLPLLMRGAILIRKAGQTQWNERKSDNEVSFAFHLPAEHCRQRPDPAGRSKSIADAGHVGVVAFPKVRQGGKQRHGFTARTMLNP